MPKVVTFILTFILSMLTSIAAHAYGTILPYMPTSVGSPSYSGTFSNFGDSATLTIWRQVVGGKSHLFIRAVPLTGSFWFCPGADMFSILQNGRDYSSEFATTQGDAHGTCDEISAPGIYLVDQWEIDVPFDENQAFTLQYYLPDATQSGSIAVPAATISGPVVTPPPVTATTSPTATYDPTTNRLTLPSVTVAGTSYTNAIVTLGSVISFNSGTAGSSNTYDTTTGVLMIPGVMYAGALFTNVKVTVDSVISVNGVAPQGNQPPLFVTQYQEQSAASGTTAALASISNSMEQQITYWGLKDSAGKPLALTESALKDSVSGAEVRTLYGANGLPWQVFTPNVGTAIMKWGTTNAEVRFYDVKRNFLLGRSIALDSAGNVTATPVPDNGQFVSASSSVLHNNRATRAEEVAATDSLTTLDDTLGSYSGDMLRLVASNCRDIEKSLQLGGSRVLSICAATGGLVPEVCAAGVAMVGAGVVAHVIAHSIDHDGAPLDASNLNADLADPANDDAAGFAMGWNNGPVANTDPRPTINQLPARYSADTTPTVRVADSRMLNAMSSTCPPYQLWAQGQCYFPGNCPSSDLEPVGETCVAKCAADQMRVNGVCVATCTPPKVYQGGACVTPTPTCDSTQDLVSNACVPKCAPNQVRGASGTCTDMCPRWHYVTTTSYGNTSCVFSGCPSDLEQVSIGWDSTCMTPCVDGLVRSHAGDGRCISPVCPSGQIFDGSRCYLPCPNGQEQWGNSCVDQCPATQSRLANGTCGCTADRVMQNGQCVCGAAYDAINGGCLPKCPSNQIRGSNGLVCVSDPNYHPPSCTAPQVLQNGLCVTPPPTTPTPPSTACPAGFVAINGQCLPSGYVPPGTGTTPPNSGGGGSGGPGSLPCIAGSGAPGCPVVTHPCEWGYNFGVYGCW